MTDLTAVVRVEHPDLALTETVAHDESATVQPISEAGTDTESGSYLFRITSANFDRFEAGLERDHTVAAFERVLGFGEEAIYRFEYTSQAKLFSPEITAGNGVALDIQNDGTTWTLTLWVPERESLARLWQYAADNGIDFELARVNEYRGPVDTADGVTEAQREALLVALDAGYFEEPREATLADVAATLDISQPAAGGLLRRGTKRLVVATLRGVEE